MVRSGQQCELRLVEDNVQKAEQIAAANKNKRRAEPVEVHEFELYSDAQDLGIDSGHLNAFAPVYARAGLYRDLSAAYGVPSKAALKKVLKQSSLPPFYDAIDLPHAQVQALAHKLYATEGPQRAPGQTALQVANANSDFEKKAVSALHVRLAQMRAKPRPQM